MSSQGTVSEDEETRDIVADNLGAIKKQIFETNRFASMWHEAKNEMENLKSEVEVLRQQLATPRECSDCPDLHNEIKTLMADLAKAKKDSSAAKVREATKKAKAAAEEAVTRLTEELKATQGSLHQRDSDLAQAKSQTAALQSEIEQLKASLAARPISPPRPIVDDSQIRRLRKEIDSLQRQLKDARDTNQCIQNDLRESTRDLGAAKTQLRSLRAECSQLKTQLVAATTASQASTAAPLDEEEIKKLKDDKKLLEFELKGVRAHLDAQKQQTASNESEVAGLREQVQELTTSMSMMQEEHHEKTKTLIGAKANIQREVVQLKKQYESAQKKLAQLSKLQENLKQAEEDMQEAQSTIKSLKNRLKAAETRVQGPSDTSPQTLNPATAVDMELVNTLKGKVDELTEKVKDKDQQISMLMSFLDTANKEKEELRSKQKKLKQELAIAQSASTVARSGSCSPISSPDLAPTPPFPVSQALASIPPQRAPSPPPNASPSTGTPPPSSRSRKRKIVESSDSDADTRGPATVAQTTTATITSSSTQPPATKRMRSMPTVSSVISSPSSSPPPDVDLQYDKPKTRSASRKLAAAAAGSLTSRSSPEPSDRSSSALSSAPATTTIGAANRRTGPASTSSMDVLEELGRIPKRAQANTPISDSPTQLQPPPPPPVIRSTSDLVRVASTHLGAILSDLDSYVPLVQANMDGFLNAVNSWLLSFGSTSETAWSTQRSSNTLCIAIPGASRLRVNSGYPEQEFPLAVLVSALASSVPELVKALVSRTRRSLCFYRIALVCPAIPTSALRAHFLDSLICGTHEFKALFNNTLIFRPSVLPGPTDPDFFSQCILQATVCTVKQNEFVNALPYHVREWFASAAITERGNVLEPLLSPTSSVFKGLDAFTLFKCLQLCPSVADTPRDAQALVSRLLFAAGKGTTPSTVLLMLRGVDFALNRMKSKPWAPTDSDISILQKFATSTSLNYTHDILASILTHVKNPQDQRRVAASLA